MVCSLHTEFYYPVLCFIRSSAKTLNSSFVYLHIYNTIFVILAKEFSNDVKQSLLWEALLEYHSSCKDEALVAGRNLESAQEQRICMFIKGATRA